MMAGEIYETLLRIFEIAKRERIPTYRAADRLAEQRIAAVGGLDRMWMGSGRGDGRVTEPISSLLAALDISTGSPDTFRPRRRSSHAILIH